MIPVGQRIRDEREAADLSQAELAERLGCTQTAISYWESGSRVLRVDDLINVARALGVPPSALLPDDDMPPDEDHTGPHVTSGAVRNEWCPQCRETSVLRVRLYTTYGDEVVQAGEITSCAVCGWTPYVTDRQLPAVRETAPYPGYVDEAN